MMFRQIVLGSFIGLAIVAATAYGAKAWLSSPTPPTSTSSTTEITPQVPNTISSATDPTINVYPNTNVPATTVQVGTFYDGKEGYSLSIPSGNSSTCIWTYAGGNAAIPYSETTYAKSATEKHTIYSSDYYNWEVTCVDDFGNRYVGVFPKKP